MAVWAALQIPILGPVVAVDLDRPLESFASVAEEEVQV
jgi:hypothetical protein